MNMDDPEHETELIAAPADELKAALFAIIDENRELRAQVPLAVRGPIWTATDGQALSSLLGLISPDCDVLRGMREYLAEHFPPNPEAWVVAGYSENPDQRGDIYGVQFEYDSRLTTGKTGEESLF